MGAHVVGVLAFLLAGQAASGIADAPNETNAAKRPTGLIACLVGENTIESCKSSTLVNCIDSAGPSFGSLRYCVIEETLILESIIAEQLENQISCYQRNDRSAGEAFSIEQAMKAEQGAWEAYRQAAISAELAANHDGLFLKSQGFLEAASVALILTRERAQHAIGKTKVICR